MSQLTILTEQEIADLPMDRLALIVLGHVHETSEWNSYNFLNSLQQRPGFGHPTLACLSEAMNWLISKGLVARGKPGQTNSDSIFVTRLGRQVLADGLATTRAIARLNVDIHPRLVAVRSQFWLGEFELAAFKAMREVEIRVREMGGFDSALIGVKLMRQAFAIGDSPGPLTDLNLDRGEQEGIQHLFAGAIATFKNPPSHRQIDYGDPSEASEVVLFADLLMRLLDRTNVQLNPSTVDD